MKHRGEAISKLLEGLDTIVAGHAKRTMEEDRSKRKESEGEQPIESTKEHVEKYEVEADLPEGHSEEAEEAAADKKHMASGGSSVMALPVPADDDEGSEPAGDASGMPMKPTPEHKPIHRPYGSDEMEQAKKEIADRLSKKPKAVRRYNA